MNTATATYTVGGTDFIDNASQTIVTDAAAGNSAPSGVVLVPGAIDENLVLDVLGQLQAQDSDPGDTHTFELALGADPRFLIVGDQLQVVPGTTFDFETETAVSLPIEVTDTSGATTLVNFVLTINNVNEAPFDIEFGSTTVPFASPGALVSLLSTLDPDVGDTHSYSVSDPRFVVVGNELRLAPGQVLAEGETVQLPVTTTDAGGLSHTETLSLTTVPPAAGGGVGASVSFLGFAPNLAGAQDVSTSVSQCLGAAGLQEVASPIDPFDGPLAVPGSLPLAAVDNFVAGASAFIQVSDVDANADAALLESVQVQVSTANGDSETLVLFETGVNTSSFVGYVPLSRSAVALQDCQLNVGINESLQVRYVDANNAADIALANALVDPLGVVFDSAEGRPINGAIITLIDVATGQPARVFGDDGVQPFPSTLISGGRVTDAGGTVYDFADGQYRFPLVAPGNYRLQVTPPNRFDFPSQILDATLQLLPGGPFALNAGSRGNDFAVPVGPAVRVDLPLDLVPVVPTDAVVEWRGFAPADPLAVSQTVAPSACFRNDNFAPSPAPVSLASGAIDVPGDLPLRAATRFRRGDVLFVQVVDADQDLDPFAADSIEVAISVTQQNDQERLQLQETGASTGVFVGYLNTQADAVAQPNSCALETSAGAQVNVDYVDVTNTADAVRASASLDPGFRLVSSVNGSPIDGVSITLVDNATGLPATGSVFASDGVTPFPATVVSGAGAQDANNNAVNFAAGSFFFPQIAPGEYRLDVDSAGAFNFPSVVDDTTLASLATGPFVLVVGSRGEAFTLGAADVAGFDIPLDPAAGDFVITKTATRETAAIGDFVQYLVSVENAVNAAAGSNLTIEDRLPQGLRFVAGSARLETQSLADPTLSPDGARLLFDLPLLPPGSTANLSYVVEVTPGTPLGSARNRAVLLASGAAVGNEAVADILIRDDLLRSKAIIAGRVLDGDCEFGTENPGLANARVWLEDGTYVITDREGKFHFEGVNPGTHVLQLDVASLPPHYELLACEKDSRRAGQAYASFVDVQAGTLWRENFYVAQREPERRALQSRLKARAWDGFITYKYELIGGAGSITDAKTTFLLADDSRYVPGSARHNGEPMPDPSGADIGALTFKLPPTDGELATHLEFQVAVLNPKTTFETKALTALKVLGEKQRTPLLTSRLRVDWPATLVDVAISRLRSANVDVPTKPIRTSPVATGQARPAKTAKVAVPVPADQQPLRVNTGAFEPGSDGIHTDSGYAFMEVAGAAPVATQALPYEIPEIDNNPAPEFDLAWLRQQPKEFAIAWPPVDHNPRIPAVTVAVVHPRGLRPALVVDGELVNPIAFEGTVVDAQRDLAVSQWRNVSISEADSLLRASLPDAPAQTTPVATRQIHFGSAPVRAELIPELSYLIADGITPPMLAVRLYDRSGRPARPGLTGEFAIEGNYAALNEARLLGLLENAGAAGVQRYRVLRDGIAYIRLEPTSETGEISLNFEFDQHRRERLRARILPGHRDWILVGLAEGVFGSNSSSGNPDLILDDNLADDVLTDGRVAFYAKGLIKGEWLLTAAYDTDKDVQGQIRQQIDPNQFYTLYGDGTQQRFDAQSQTKLYLKLERGRFAALFGDFDTGLDRTEFTRYARTVNGLQAGHYGRRWEVQGFATETAQQVVRDEIRGDGTSGTYRLSNSRILINSERIALVVRNRFRPEEIESTTTLTRYRDYSIDYDRGTLLFRQPVFGQDENFNPTFIEAQYELDSGNDNEDWVAGARAAYRLDDRDSEVAVTYVTDQQDVGGGELVGIDARWEFAPGSRIEAEFATTQRQLPLSAAVNERGQAYRLEVLHEGERVAGRAFLREQESGFGLEQQVAIGVGARSYGVEGEYRVNNQLQIRAEAFAQDDLDQNADRQVLGVEAQYILGSTRYLLGARSVREETAADDSNGNSQREANQITAGVSHRMLNNRLTLRANTETSFSGGADNADFPSRAVIGAQYDLNNRIALITEQEFSWSDERNTQDGRVGFTARPWDGADLISNVARQTSENGERLFATTGLLQRWQLNERWLLDFGMDRVQTLSESTTAEQTPQALTFRPVTPPVTGSFDQDFTAAFAGATYRRDSWDIMSRLEFHQGDLSDKWNLLLGANRQLADGKIVSASAALLNEEFSGGDVRDTADVRMGLAWRPVTSPWLFLNRLDLQQENLRSGGARIRTRKLVDNFNSNYRPNDRSQLSLQAGVKYVRDNFDGLEFDGVTALLGAEYRHDLGERFDVGVQGSVLRSFASDTTQYSAGVSVGVALFGRTWTSLGYNVVGFNDPDFSAAEYTARGWYLKVRLRLDQDLIGRFLGFVGVAQHPVGQHPVDRGDLTRP